MLIVDAHLDLSYNAIRGRPVHLPASQQTADEEGIPTVGLPDLRAGNVSLICATIFCEPALAGKPGYRTADEAKAAALAQRHRYRQREIDGSIRFILSPKDLTDPPKFSQTSAILLLEGTDALSTADDVQYWFTNGLRIVGLAWKATRHAGGTGQPGPLTPEGIALVKELDRHKIIHDLSHLAEQSFWQLLDLSPGPVMASHSNCRSIVPTDRQLSDDMIRAIAQRGGVIGINFFDKFLLPPHQYRTRRATLTDVVHHMKMICDITGSTRHVAIGTDMDGGLGRDEIPHEIQTSADLPKVFDALSLAGFSDADVMRIMGKNWIGFFAKALPLSR